MPPVASELTSTTYAGIIRMSSRLRGYHLEEGNMGVVRTTATAPWSSLSRRAGADDTDGDGGWQQVLA